MDDRVRVSSSREVNRDFSRAAVRVMGFLVLFICLSPFMGGGSVSFLTELRGLLRLRGLRFRKSRRYYLPSHRCSLSLCRLHWLDGRCWCRLFGMI